MSQENLTEAVNRMNIYDDRNHRGTSQQGSSNQPSSSSDNAFSGSTITLEKTTSIPKKDLPYQNQTFAERPGTIFESKLGKKTRLISNFVRIALNERSIYLHQYDISISMKNKIERKRERTSLIFWDFFDQNRDIFPNVTQFLYNDVNMLWSEKKLNIRNGDEEFPVIGKNNRQYATIRIKFTTVLEFSQNAKLSSDRDMSVTIVDTAVSQRARCPFRPGEASYFTPSHNGMYSQYFKCNNVRLTIALGSGLEAWTGIHFAAKLNLQGGPLANIDLCHTVFYRPEYCLVHLLMDILVGHTCTEEEFEENTRRLTDYGMNPRNRDNVCKLLKGKRVRMNYSRRQREFRFEGLTDKPASAHMFTADNGERISVAEHFHRQGIRLRFPLLPCVVGPAFNGQSSRSVFPMEVLTTSSIVQKYKGRITESVLAPMIRGTAYTPEQRFAAIKTVALDGYEGRERGENVPPMIVDNDEWMRNFDLKIDKKFVEVDATILPPPTLIYGNSTYHDQHHHGVWEAVNRQGEYRTVLSSQCEKTKKMKRLIPCLITIESHRANRDVYVNHACFYTLFNVVEKFGQPVLRQLEGNLPVLYYREMHNQQVNSIDSLRQKLTELKNRVKSDPNLQSDTFESVPLILFVFANRSTTINTRNIDIISDYAIIKQLCDGELGLNCQGILEKTFSSMTAPPAKCATAHNMAYKILAKIGTTHYMLEKDGKHKNWSRLTDPKDPTLVLGIDVTHPGDFDLRRGGVYACSVASIVGNIDLEVSKFGESINIQPRGEERIVRMETAINERICAFREYTGIRPMHIVIYRDGISESEFKRILYEEKSTVTRACEMLDSDYRPTITYIVVSKRHHTRMKAMREEDCEGNAFNVKPGTLVESTITTKDYFDFYLISQFGPLGTSRPTHYYVLHDDWKPSKAFWQTITYALTYSYVRTTKSISVPAPVMYAHLCAKRAKDRLVAIEEIHKQDNKRLNLNQADEHVQVLIKMRPHESLRGMLYC